MNVPFALSRASPPMTISVGATASASLRVFRVTFVMRVSNRLSYLDRSRLRPCVAAAEFLDERADVRRLLEFHDLAASKREHVHPSEIHKATRSLRSFTTRPEDHYFVALRQEICRSKVL